MVVTSEGFFWRLVHKSEFESGDSGPTVWGHQSPSAELFDPVGDLVGALDAPDALDDDTVISFETDVAGTHYDGIRRTDGKASPTWEFRDPAEGGVLDLGRLIAESALHLDSPDGYIDWLNVVTGDGELPANHFADLDYNGIYRVLTIGGKAPKYSGKDGATVGSPYTTIYVVMKGCDNL